jgi:hypothetical protein
VGAAHQSEGRERLLFSTSKSDGYMMLNTFYP